MFNVSRINLWNRTKKRAENLKVELESLRSTFKNQNLDIYISDTTAENVANADVVVTATFTKTPILFYDSLKKNVHINGKTLIKSSKGGNLFLCFIFFFNLKLLGQVKIIIQN